MKILFGNARLRALCEDQTRAKRRFGSGQCEEAAGASERLGALPCRMGVRWLDELPVRELRGGRNEGKTSLGSNAGREDRMAVVAVGDGIVAAIVRQWK